MFIDATYEGDLIAAAKVPYRVGREANAEFGETLNGVQPRQAKAHQFFPGVSPYVVPGDPASGLLPGILRERLLAEGRAVEADLRAEDLAGGFLIGNALRGLMRARLKQ
mgnify:CR=1 FL=1